jgi:hypothetical protein
MRDHHLGNFAILRKVLVQQHPRAEAKLVGSTSNEDPPWIFISEFLEERTQRVPWRAWLAVCGWCPRPRLLHLLQLLQLPSLVHLFLLQPLQLFLMLLLLLLLLVLLLPQRSLQCRAVEASVKGVDKV